MVLGCSRSRSCGSWRNSVTLGPLVEVQTSAFVYAERERGRPLWIRVEDYAQENVDNGKGGDGLG